MPMSHKKPEKSFNNAEFINSRDGRIVRLMAEYLEPQKRLREAGIEDTIVFFGSARTLAREDAESRLASLRKKKGAMLEEITRAERDLEMSYYYESARKLAYRLTKWAEQLGNDQGDEGHRFSILTGGGMGIMEAANRGALEAAGSSIGMNISLPFKQYPNEYITSGLDFEFHYFFMRKFWLVYMAKAAVVMPGGFGTLDEFMEVLTLVQTNKIRRKLPIVLFGADYWTKIVEFEPMLEFGTISPEDLNLFHVTDSVDNAFEWLKNQLSEWAVDHPGAGLTTKLEQMGKLDG